MPASLKVIFIGDLVGKIARQAVKKIIPIWREKYSPDFIIANGENLAHGFGFTAKTVSEVLKAGVDLLTSGDHAFDKIEGVKVLEEGTKVLRPANFPEPKPGKGFCFLKKQVVDNEKALFVINLVGRVFMKKKFDCPFKTLDEILKKIPEKDSKTPILIDFHGEATSEKVAFGWYVDGRVGGVVGTHTHVPTSDYHILPKGTAYVTDVGMVGAYDSVIGMTKEPIIQNFLTQGKERFEPVEKGLCLIGAVLLVFDQKTGLAKQIKRIDEKIYID